MDQPVCHKCWCELHGIVIDCGYGDMCADCYDADLKRRNDLGAQNELLLSALRAARELLGGDMEHGTGPCGSRCFVCWQSEGHHAGCEYEAVLAQIDAALEAAE